MLVHFLSTFGNMAGSSLKIGKNRRNQWILEEKAASLGHLGTYSSNKSLKNRRNHTKMQDIFTVSW